MKVFIFDPLWPQLVDEKLNSQLAETGAQVVVVSDVKPLGETRELFEGEEERIVCINPDYVGWKLGAEDYQDIPNLKAILTGSTSFDWVDLKVANDRGIAVCNIRGFSTQAVAEWAVTMMMNLARQTPRIIKDGFPLDFDKDFMKYRGVQLKGKKAGIIGLGNNGTAIAERATGLGMEVVHWSRTPVEGVYKHVELDELLRTADVIFPTFAKNQETNELLTKERLSLVKSSAMIVDTIEIEGLQEHIVDLVASGKLFGYGFEAKPGAFSQYEGNIWAAPAYGWVTYESMYNSEVKLVENIISAIRGEFPNRVN